jgi:signal transduction histidine kinase/ActR/RegA family two-component response regulator
MDVRREIKPARDALIASSIFAALSLAIITLAPPSNPSLHTMLDTSIFVLSGLLAVQLWDMGWRFGQRLAQLAAICFACAASFEFLHALTAIEFGPGSAGESLSILRPSTWPPPSYLLPIGLAGAYALRHGSRRTIPVLGIALMIVGIVLVALFLKLPRYSPPFLGLTRPTLVPVPVLWIAVFILYWRQREDRIARAIAWFALFALVANCAIIFSRAPADAAAMVSHVGKFCGRLFLLFSFTQMGTADTARRMKSESDLRGLNDELEARVRERTLALELAVMELRAENAERTHAERRALAQNERLDLLRQITHAIGERQDLASIYQAVLGRIEDQMPVDFACLLKYEQVERVLTVSRIGAKSIGAARELGLNEKTAVEVAVNGVSRCLHGELVYEPDTAVLEFEMPRRFAKLGLRSLVAAPLVIEKHGSVQGVLLVARADPGAFSSGECEFLLHLCSQVALATQQAQLHSALQHAYDDMRNTQQAVMQQERLRALGQMASGIAHDVNNAMSPVTLYLESLMEREPGLSDRGRKHVETMQRAIGDVARTISRMGTFYRRDDAQRELLPVNVNMILEQIPDLTRPRWSDIAQAQGLTIALRVEGAAGAPTILAIESEVREACINLVLNAADAMPRGGTIILRSRKLEPTHAGDLARIAIEVIDDGVGMDEETRLHCLEPFYTTKGERGTRLGLAMVYGIAERHSALLEIESAPGKGTTVRLAFAIAPDNSMTSTTVRRARALQATRILFVDDDPLLLRSLRDALEFDGHEVHAADGGQSAIDAFEASADAGRPFPAVITDLGMPHVDGRQVAAAVKRANPGTRVLMLTGWGHRMSVADDMPASVDRLLGKPPNMWQLREALAGLAEN